MSPCFLYVLFFRMPSTSYNHRLQDIFLSQKASYFLTSLISIKERHRAVHKYQAKAIVLLKCILYQFNRFVTIKCLLNDFRNIFITSLHQNNFKSNCIVRFIIHDQNTSILVDLINYFEKLRLYFIFEGLFGFFLFIFDNN